MSNQSKITNRWPFTKKKANTNVSTPSRHMQTTTPSAQWYRHITELPLSRFIDVVVDDYYAALIITGNPAPEELLLAWAGIQSEYADAIGDHEHRMYVSLFKEVSILAINLQTIEYLVEILEQVYQPELCNMLNKMLLTTFKFDPADPEKYKATLKRCLMRSKGIKIDLELKQGQLKAMEKKNDAESPKPSREYFQSILITLSDHAQYAIQDSITVFEFCSRIKRYTQYCEQAKRQGGKR